RPRPGDHVLRLPGPRRRPVPDRRGGGRPPPDDPARPGQGPGPGGQPPAGRPVTPALRRRVFLAAAVVMAALLLWGLTGLPDYGVYAGPYGDVLNQVAVAERKATNVVASVTFDYRGVDTLGEEFILFAAVIGVAILLRAQRDEAEEPPDEDADDRRAPGTSNAVRVLGLALLGPVVLYGLYLVAHGHLTPGGGF